MRTLRAAVEVFFTANAPVYNLDASSLDVSWVLNWGGFVNQSFHITDGRTRLHLKLATSDDAKSALRRWHDVDGALQQYHAPPILAWVDIANAGGLLFPFVEGVPPELSADVLQAIIPVLDRLWNDHALATMLPQQPATAADAYFRTYHERFTEDLRYIRGAQPDFVTPAVFDLLVTEVERLAQRVRSEPPFQVTLTTPVHGDLWLDNILWQDRTAWHILDWDDLTIGDPAIDIAMLSGPSAADVTPLKKVDEIRSLLSDDVAQRLPLLGRASLLDWTIDPLSDWIDADAAGEQADHVRREKERVHREAFALYCERYGGS